MQLPRLRLPRLSLGGSGARLTVLYVAYTTVLFVVFLLLTFPHDIVVRRLLNSVGTAGSDIEFNSVNFAWWKGYQIDGLRVGSPAGDGDAPVFEMSHFWIRPAVSQLVRGNPYTVQVSAELYGGSADGDVSLKNGALTGTLQWRGLSVNRYRTLTALLEEGQLAGRFSGLVSFETRLANPTSGQATGEVSIDGAGVTAAKWAGITVPDVSLKQTRLKFKLSPGRLEVQELNASGDISVQASGQVNLKEPLPQSTLNLHATILQTATTPDALKAALALIPRAPGAKLDAPVNIAGTLGNPRFR